MDTSKLSRKPEERSVGVGGGRGGRYPRDFLKYCPMRGSNTFSFFVPLKSV